MRVAVVGGYGGIGSALVEILAPLHESVIPVGRGNSTPADASAVVVCSGSHRAPWGDCYDESLAACEPESHRIVICLSGGGIGGPPSTDLPVDYIASKAAICAMVEWYALKYPDRQFFAVAPGPTATKLTGFKGVDPKIPAAFIARLLTGKYGHLSGCLLAAQRDDLDTTPGMKLRRVKP
jgi:NAD(P)-dependent dehydrogenase (short-subunit alcohol dehydrogenase family)